MFKITVLRSEALAAEQLFSLERDGRKPRCSQSGCRRASAPATLPANSGILWGKKKKYFRGKKMFANPFGVPQSSCEAQGGTARGSATVSQSPTGKPGFAAVTDWSSPATPRPAAFKSFPSNPAGNTYQLLRARCKGCLSHI